jgi:V/A-type H+/Na+-transporting ATPase subunit F
MQVLVIGHPEAVLGYSLVGVRGITATTADEANHALDQAFSNHDVGIILVTEDVSTLIRNRMDQLKLRSTTPLVVEISSPHGPLPNQPSITDIVFRAIGVKL